MATKSISIKAPASSLLTLIVQDKPIHCSRRLILSSSLFMDMAELVDDDASPIPIPEFISRQIMLDLVEMVEIGDWECAHLILVSLSYLLDFLIALDFLGCDKLKTVVEEKVKEKLDDSNCRDVLHYTKDILGLDNTVRNVIEYMCDRVRSYYDQNLEVYHCDLFQDEYVNFTPSLMRMVLNTTSLGSFSKFTMFSKWVKINNEDMDDVLKLLLTLQFKELDDCKLHKISSTVREWEIGEENIKTFEDHLKAVKMEKALDEKTEQNILVLRRDLFYGLGLAGNIVERYVEL